MIPWNTLLNDWQTLFDPVIYPPLEDALVNNLVSELPQIPERLVDFYRCCNGLSYRWFTVLPLEDPNNIKRTWDSLQRANDPRYSVFLGGNRELLQRFLVFARLNAETCAVIDRLDYSIWYEEKGELFQTKMTLEESITTFLQEAKVIF